MTLKSAEHSKLESRLSVRRAVRRVLNDGQLEELDSLCNVRLGRCLAVRPIFLHQVPL